MLTIQHDDGKGAKHRKEMDDTILYRWLTKNNFPTGFSIYCMNHNRKDQVVRARESRNILWSKYCACYDRQKIIVFDYYGGKCITCGETDYDMLEMDHINDDGCGHRKEVGRKIYRWIIRNNFPDNLQLLCANCNLKKEMELYNKKIVNND
ncbi:hypothetical protein LCGC14_1741310 [marine sediment metagenome]|uniref:HNH nuclease domain-containing protein n=1 Tax=marine sediment metagenome TaxID=412755 RepID=A0A0F9H6L4_9ZZZZ